MNVELSSKTSKKSRHNIKDLYIAGIGFYSNSIGDLKDYWRSVNRNFSEVDTDPITKEQQILECLKHLSAEFTIDSASIVGNDADSIEFLKRNISFRSQLEKIPSFIHKTIVDAFSIAAEELSSQNSENVFIIQSDDESTIIFQLTTESTGSVSKIESIGNLESDLDKFLETENKYIVTNKEISTKLSAHKAWIRIVDFTDRSEVDLLLELILSIQSRSMLPGDSLLEIESNLKSVEISRPWVTVGLDASRNGALILTDSKGKDLFLHLSEGEYSFEQNQDSEVFLLGAKSKEELVENSTLLVELIRKRNFRHKDLAFTVNEKYKNENSTFRLAIVSKDKNETLDKLIKAIELLNSGRVIIDDEKEGIYFASLDSRIQGKSAFILPGLGSAYEGMLKDLYESNHLTEDLFNYLDNLGTLYSNNSLPSETIFPGRKAKYQSTESLLKAEFAVAAVAVSSNAIDSYLKGINILPEAYLGMSTGEFANYVLNGYVGIDTAAPLFYSLSLSVAKKLPNEKNKYITVNLFCAAETARKAMDEISGELYLIADLAPKHVMVTGETSSIEALVKNLESSSQVVSHKMSAPILYHTPLVDSTYSEQDEERLSISIKDTDISIPSWSSSLAGIAPTDRKEMELAFKNMLRRTIRFRETVESMYKAGYRKFIEVGPGSILTTKVKEILKDQNILAIASNLNGKSATTQLNHVAAKLFCHGENPQMEELYKSNSAKIINLNSSKQPQEFNSHTNEFGNSKDMIVSNFFTMLNSVHGNTMKASQELLNTYLDSLNPISSKIIYKDINLVLTWCNPASSGTQQEKWYKTHFNQQEIDDIKTKFKNTERREEFVLGRVAAKEAAMNCLRLHDEGVRLDYKEIAVKNDKNGIPKVSTPLDTIPLVSISHKKNFACALSTIRKDNYSIGVDVEKIKPFEDSLIELVLSKAEYKSFIQTSDNRDFEFLKVWTAKEALFKAFEGRFKPTEIETIEIDSDKVILSVDKATYPITLNVIDNHILAIALIKSRYE